MGNILHILLKTVFSIILRKNFNHKNNKQLFFFKQGYDKNIIKNKFHTNLLKEIRSQNQYKISDYAYVYNSLKIKKYSNKLSHLIISLFFKNFSKNFKVIQIDHQVIKTMAIKTKNTSKEFYSEKFHKDNYLPIMFKAFVLLRNTTKSHGPTRVIEKKYTKKFLNESNYRGRKDYEEKNLNYIKYLTGKKNTLYFLDSTSTYHAAGIPKKERLMLILTFAIVPKNKIDLNLLLENPKKEISPQNLCQPLKLKTLVYFILLYIKNIFDLKTPVLQDKKV